MLNSHVNSRATLARPRCWVRARRREAGVAGMLQIMAGMELRPGHAKADKGCVTIALHGCRWAWKSPNVLTLSDHTTHRLRDKHSFCDQGNA